MQVLFFFFIEVHAGLALFVDQSEFELVKMLRTELEFAGAVFAALYFAVQAGRTFRFLRFALLFVAHELMTPVSKSSGYLLH